MSDMPIPPAHVAHATHDVLLVSALAAGDAEGPDRTAAEALVASCAECGELLADLRSIAAATRSLPTPARPRDFRLTEADAAPAGRGFLPWRRSRRPSPTGGWRGALQPVGAGLATLGVVGLLVAGVLSAGPGRPSTSTDSGQGAPVPAAASGEREYDAGAVAPSGGKSVRGSPASGGSGDGGFLPGGPSAPPPTSSAGPSTSPASASGPGASSIPVASGEAVEPPPPAPVGGAPSPLAIASAALLALGLVAWAAGRALGRGSG